LSTDLTVHGKRLLVVLARAGEIAVVVERIPEHVPGGGCAVAIASLGIKTLGFSQRGRSFVGLTKPLRSPPFAGTCLGEDELRTQHQSLLRGATGRLLLQLEVAERFCRQGFCEVDSSIISFGRSGTAGSRALPQTVCDGSTFRRPEDVQFRK